jgi:hypothetical protein
MIKVDEQFLCRFFGSSEASLKEAINMNKGYYIDEYHNDVMLWNFRRNVLHNGAISKDELLAWLKPREVLLHKSTVSLFWVAADLAQEYCPYKHLLDKSPAELRKMVLSLENELKELQLKIREAK